MGRFAQNESRALFRFPFSGLAGHWGRFTVDRACGLTGPAIRARRLERW